MSRTAAVLAFSPRPGRSWAGGVYVARVADYDLIAGPQLDDTADWAAATAWAASLNAYGYGDFTLPRVGELRLLSATFPKFFQDARWWSSETHPALPTDAFVLHHGDRAIHWGKQHRCHAIAVRRQLHHRRS